MPCCGNKRNEYAARSASGYSSTNPSPSPVHQAKVASDVYFTYTGATALSVTGNITGKRYRFAGQGDIQLIDWRDASGMMAVPVLEKIKKGALPGK